MEINFLRFVEYPLISKGDYLSSYKDEALEVIITRKENLRRGPRYKSGASGTFRNLQVPLGT